MQEEPPQAFVCGGAILFGIEFIKMPADRIFVNVFVYFFVFLTVANNVIMKGSLERLFVCRIIRFLYFFCDLIFQPAYYRIDCRGIFSVLRANCDEIYTNTTIIKAL